MSDLLMSQLAATNMVYARFSLEYFIESMKRLGVHNIELYGCSPHFHFWDTDENPVPKLKKQFAGSGLKIVSLMPEENTYPINLAAKESQLRKQTVALYKQFISSAAELDCPQMLLCPGRPSYDQPYWDSYSYARDSISELVEYAEKEGITLMYEVLNNRESYLAANRFDYYRMVKDIDSPCFKCCVDMVHVAANGERMEQYFQLLGDKIGHIHTVDGKPTGHLKWGDGNIDLDDNLNALRKHDYKGYIPMEMAAGRYMTDPEPHYRDNIEYLRKHFDGGEL